MAKYRLTIIYDPDGMHGDTSFDFMASTDKSAKTYAKGLMTSKTIDPQSNIGQLKKYRATTGRYHRIGVFRPTFMGGYTFYPESR